MKYMILFLYILSYISVSYAIIRQTFIAVVYCNDNVHQFFTRCTSLRTPGGTLAAVVNNQGFVVYPVVYPTGRDPVTLCARFGGVLGVGQINFLNFPLTINSDTGNINNLAISQPITINA